MSLPRCQTSPPRNVSLHPKVCIAGTIGNFFSLQLFCRICGEYWNEPIHSKCPLKRELSMLNKPETTATRHEPFRTLLVLSLSTTVSHSNSWLQVNYVNQSYRWSFFCCFISTLLVSEQTKEMPPLNISNTHSGLRPSCPVLITSCATFTFNALALMLLYNFFNREVLFL